MKGTDGFDFFTIVLREQGANEPQYFYVGSQIPGWL